MNTSQAEFTRAFAAHIAEISSYQDSTTDVLALQKSLGPNEFLIRIRRIGSSYTSEIHKLIGETYVRLSADSYNDTFISAEQRLAIFLGGVHVPILNKDEFCLGNLGVEGKFVSESAKVLFKNPTHEDARVSVNVDTYRSDEAESLFDRVSGGDSLLARFGINPDVIRKREFVAAGMAAQEWMSWMPPTGQNESKNLHFALETRRDRADRGHPSVHIEFKTGRRGKDGVRINNTYDEAGAIKLWDDLISSLSLR
jgi:hypothetical protein